MSGTMNIEYTAHIWKEGNQYVAHAMPLDVMSSGQTPEEASKALDEAVHLFLVTAADMGNLEEILQESGYEHKRGTWVGASCLRSASERSYRCTGDRAGPIDN